MCECESKAMDLLVYLCSYLHLWQQAVSSHQNKEYMEVVKNECPLKGLWALP